MANAVNKEMIYIIGHSTHEIGTFVALLKQHRINAVADVRSVPYSLRQPQFNRTELAEVLRTHGIAYVFLGKELGARSDDPDCYEKGRVKYRLLATTPLFRSGIKRIRDGSCRWNIALMCAEKDPLDCHRTILVGGRVAPGDCSPGATRPPILVARELVETGSDVGHILANEQVESQSAAMARLSERLKLPEPDMVSTAQELEEQAYAAQERRIAYVDQELTRDAKEVQQ